ncbi:MAG: hypothetical protein ABJA83_15140 [Burkholderiaceae bacterium]
MNVGLIGLAAAIAACCWLAARTRETPRFEVGVSRNGAIVLRECARAELLSLTESQPAEVVPARVVFASPWLMTLRSGLLLIPVWPDCLPRSIYRQLWVHLHWGKVAPSGDDNKSTPTARGASAAG